MFIPPTLECKNWHCPIYCQNESRLLQRWPPDPHQGLSPQTLYLLASLRNISPSTMEFRGGGHR